MCLVGVVLVVCSSSSNPSNVDYGFAIIGAAAVGAVAASCQCRAPERAEAAGGGAEAVGRGVGGLGAEPVGDGDGGAERGEAEPLMPQRSGSLWEVPWSDE